MLKKINLFIPGRLCVFGEHSDWASLYRKIDKKIEKGYAITIGIDLGIDCEVKYSECFILNDNNKSFSCRMDENLLNKCIQDSTYYSYVASSVYTMLKKYNVSGLQIDIVSNTLPESTGLSSSSAICVLIIRAFNVFYGLGLNCEEEMELAYLSERHISKCGRMDQICACGKQTSLLEIDGEQVNISKLDVGKTIYFVVANLQCQKNTNKILTDLNACYLNQKYKENKDIIKCLGEKNKKIIKEAVKAFKNGDSKKIGQLMNEAQYNFDKFVVPKCSELIAPKMHTILSDKFVLKNIYGGKCVGSGGDGAVQLIVKDEITQKKVIKYLNKVYGCLSYPINFEKNTTQRIQKAIVPLAGNGTRMYPYTKSIPKAFIPIIHNGMLKPIFIVILEEIFDSGISEIALIIDKKDKNLYDNFFKQYRANNSQKKYENKIEKIYNSITYIYQKEKLGLGHAVSLCKKFINNQDFLLALGDQLPISYISNSCLNQVLESYNRNKMPIIASVLTDIKNVHNYGIVYGILSKNSDNEFLIDKIFEKPSEELASKECYLMRNNNKEYYSIFGYYVLNKNIFKILDSMIENKDKEKKEYQLTTALNKFIENENVKSLIVNGKFLDFGNINSYCQSIKDLIDLDSGDKY